MPRSGADWPRRRGQAASRRQRSFDEKESRRWLTAAEQVTAEVGAVAERVTVVGDSESDVFDVFARRPEGCWLLVRARRDRCMADGKRLFSLTDSLPEGGRAQVDLPAAPGRRARTMTLALRFSRVTLMRPQNASKQDPETLPEAVPVWVVDAREIDPPPGAEPAHWRLLTTDQVNDAADARRVDAPLPAGPNLQTSRYTDKCPWLIAGPFSGKD